MAKVVTVIQARMASSRLPGKVLRPLLGQPLLLHLIERVQAAKRVDTVVVATTYEAQDNPIAELCQTHHIHCFRGHPTDLLDRHYQTGYFYDADVIVKIPSDCPLIDPTVIDKVIGCFLDPKGLVSPKLPNLRENPSSLYAYEYVSNLHPATYPDGNDVEAMTMDALEVAHRQAKRDFEREHTTPFFWENPDRFRLGNVTWETGLDCSMSQRWTIDYEADYGFVKAVYEALYPHKALFGLNDILALLAERPDIIALNNQYVGVNWYRHHLEELKTITAAQTNLETRDWRLETE